MMKMNFHNLKECGILQLLIRSKRLLFFVLLAKELIESLKNNIFGGRAGERYYYK
jgi:hypothetical protein